MSNHLKHFRGMKATAAQSFEVTHDRHPIFRGVLMNRGQLVIKIQIRMQIGQLALRLQLAHFVTDLRMQCLAQGFEISRVEYIRHNDITLFVEESDLLRGKLGLGFHHEVILPDNVGLRNGALSL